VLRIRRLLSCAAVLFATLALTSSALATSSRQSHSRQVSGVVLAINAQQHTLKLRVKHAVRHRASAAARTATASVSDNRIVVSFGDATVSGPNGAVAVGDRIRVTCGTLGSTAVASSIDVIGQPNGGAAGRGAAVPGTVTAIDSADGTLKLALGSGDSQLQDSFQARDLQVSSGSVDVIVSATTILAVGDSNGDGQITIDDIAIGDHVVVFTEDASTDPIVAVGILDATQPGANSHAGDPSPSSDASGDGAPTYQNLNGTVSGLLPPDGLQVTVAGDGSLAGRTVTVDVTSSTRYKGVSGFDAIAVGDQVRVYSQSLQPLPIIAAYIGDGVANPGSDSQPPPSNPPTPSDAVPTRFGGTVTDVRGDGLTLTVTSGGPLSGQSVIVAVRPSTTFAGAADLSEIVVGDAVEVYTDDAGASPVVAAKVVDDSTPPS